MVIAIILENKIRKTVYLEPIVIYKIKTRKITIYLDLIMVKTKTCLIVRIKNLDSIVATTILAAIMLLQQLDHLTTTKATKETLGEQVVEGMLGVGEEDEADFFND